MNNFTFSVPQEIYVEKGGIKKLPDVAEKLGGRKAFITDHSRNYKLTVFSYKLIPSYAILDAELLTTAPASVAAACGVDAMKSGNILVNPRSTKQSDVEMLYRKAL